MFVFFYFIRTYFHFSRGFDESHREHWWEPWWSFGCGPRSDWLGCTSEASAWGHDSSPIWSRPGWRQRLLFASCFLFLHYILFWSYWFLVDVLGASDSTISGWANVFEAIYNDIGGCLFYFSCFLAFGLTLLMLDLLLGRLRHHLKNVDYFKLLRMNL